MDKFIDFLSNNVGIAILLIVCIMIIFITLIVAILFLILKGKFKAKIAGQEFAVNDDDSEPDKKPLINSENKSNSSFIDVLSVIISDSVDVGYRKSTKRQELFDTQIKHTYSHINGIISKLISEYIKLYPKGDVNMIQLILNHLFDIFIINHLRSIFQEDKLAEKSKEQILEMNRSIIQNPPSQIIVELTKFIKSNTTTNIDTEFCLCIEKYSEDIKDAIKNSLISGYEDALLFLQEVEKIQIEFSKHITNMLASYDPSIKQHKNLPQSWELSFPPNSIVGGK